MRKQDRKRADVPESEPPPPEAQGDGEPAPEAVQDGAEEQGDGAGPGDHDTRAATEPDVARLLEEQKDKYLRLAAEYDNYRRRSSKERLESGARAQADLVMRMLEAIDDLGRFADIDPDTTDAATLHRGIELVEQKLLKTLTAAGLEVINPIDQSFDPNLHEAITTEPALSSEDDNTVGRVYQPGYRFAGQLLRPARVVVKQWRG